MDNNLKDRLETLDIFMSLYNSLLIEGIEANVLEKDVKLKEKVEKLKKAAESLSDDFEFDYSSDEAFLKSAQKFMNEFKNN